jgi:leader peptidase (prepilin peptidase) / N-methyltransferase
MPWLPQMSAVFAFFWGAIWGSFLNVLIYRLPRDESVLTPPSHCPHCDQRIRWYQNIPIASYLALGGRCASCREAISVRYPLVELVAAMLSLAIWQTIVTNPWVPSFSIALGIFSFLFLLAMGLVAITFIDLDHMVIPDVLSLPLIAVGLVYGLALGTYFQLSWLDSLIGAAAGAATIALVIGVYFVLTRRDGMGWGDAKLMAVIGAFLGWKCLPFVLLAGSIQGIVYAAVALLSGTDLVSFEEEDAEEEPGADDQPVSGEGIQVQSSADTEQEELPARQTPIRRLAIPFGPFLALAAFEWLFFSRWIEQLFQAIFQL